MISEIVLASVLVFMVAFLCWREHYHSRELEKLEDRYFEERRQLIDRLMARDFTQYKQAEMAEKLSTRPANEEESYYNISDVGM